jgi:hypothetical protein
MIIKIFILSKRIKRGIYKLISVSVRWVKTMRGGMFWNWIDLGRNVWILEYSVPGPGTASGNRNTWCNENSAGRAIA